jgi:hypothetical protein
MSERTVSLAIHESLHFPAKYHEVDGESVCTVKQDDIEAFVKYHDAMNSAYKFLKVTFALVVISTVVLGYFALNPTSEIQYMVPTTDIKNPQG